MITVKDFLETYTGEYIGINDNFKVTNYRTNEIPEELKDRTIDLVSNGEIYTFDYVKPIPKVDLFLMLTGKQILLKTLYEFKEDLETNFIGDAEWTEKIEKYKEALDEVISIVEVRADDSKSK